MEDKIKKVTESDLLSMSINEILEVHSIPYFRVLRVYSGWLYNFYDEIKDDYRSEWVYVPLLILK